MGLAGGTALKTDAEDTTYTEDVVVYLLSDPQNIDSKMVTLIKHNVASKDQIFATLYKWDAN